MNVFKSSYVVIPAIAGLTMLLGSYFAATGMGWYRTIHLPTWIPDDWTFSVAWLLIYVLTAACVLLIWQRMERSAYFYALIFLFCLNAFLNVLWSYLFFHQHLIGFACIDAILLELVTCALALLLWNRSKIESMLLWPYAAWGFYAVLLNALIWLKN